MFWLFFGEGLNFAHGVRDGSIAHGSIAVDDAVMLERVFKEAELQQYLDSGEPYLK